MYVAKAVMQLIGLKVIYGHGYSFRKRRDCPHTEICRLSRIIAMFQLVRFLSGECLSDNDLAGCGDRLSFSLFLLFVLRLYVHNQMDGWMCSLSTFIAVVQHMYIMLCESHHSLNPNTPFNILHRQFAIIFCFNN